MTRTEDFRIAGVDFNVEFTEDGDVDRIELWTDEYGQDLTAILDRKVRREIEETVVAFLIAEGKQAIIDGMVD